MQEGQWQREAAIKKSPKRAFSPAPGSNPGLQLGLAESMAVQPMNGNSRRAEIMLPANIYRERRLGSHDWSASHAFATAAMSSYTFSFPIPSAGTGDLSASPTFLAGPFARISRELAAALAATGSYMPGQSDTASLTFAAWNRDLSRPGMPLDNLMRTTIAGLRDDHPAGCWAHRIAQAVAHRLPLHSRSGGVE